MIINTEFEIFMIIITEFEDDVYLKDNMKSLKS